MKYLKIVLLIILVLIIFIMTTWVIIKKYYLINMVHARIEQSIGENIENDYQFTFDAFNINWFSKNAKLSGFNLLFYNQTDTVSYFKGDLIVHIQSWRNIIFDKQKIIKDIILKEADFYYAKDYPMIVKSKTGNDNAEVEISNVSATGKLNFANKHKEQSGQLSSNFDIAIALNYNSKYEFSVDNLINQIADFKVSKFHYFLPDGFYQIIINEIAFTKFDDIALKHIIINPIDSRKTFALKKKVATGFTSVSIDSVHLSKFDRKLDERIFINQIHFYQPIIDVFKDKNYPENQKYKAIFVDLLRELKIPVYVRTIDLSNMLIQYTELANKGDEAGELFFSEANARITNITNVKDSIELSRNMLIEAEAKFYGEGNLKTSISYELLSKSGQFDINGSMSSMDITIVNTILSKLVPVKIKSGQLDELSFDFSGTRIHSAGEMRFKYSDLNVELLEVDYLKSSFTRNMMSRVGNMVLRNSNPSRNGKFKIGEINKDRDITKSTFNYWWVSLQSGFLSTLGVSAEKQKSKYN